MTVVAVGVEALTLEAVHDALSESSTFQTWVGATGTPTEKAALAYARIYEIEVETYTAPCALLDIGGFSIERLCATGGGRHDGSIRVMFLMNIASDDDAGEACRHLINQTGAIMQDMVNHATLNIVSVSRDDSPMRTSEDQEDSGESEYAVQYTVEVWGFA